jgi:hypothetical protein
MFEAIYLFETVLIFWFTVLTINRASFSTKLSPLTYHGPFWCYDERKQQSGEYKIRLQEKLNLSTLLLNHQFKTICQMRNSVSQFLLRDAFDFHLIFFL